MRKSLKSLLTAVLLSFSCLFAASCTGSSSIVGIKMSSEEVIDVPFGNFSYEGIKVTILYESGSNREIDLEESMISEVERLKFFQIGNQDVKVTYRTSFSTTMKINVVLNEFNDIYDLVGYTCVYDGNPHEVKLNHELPEGATIVYPKGNIFTQAGTYEVKGVITKSGYATKEVTATLKILENEYDEEAIVFEDKTVPFNGEAQTIEAENVPEGVNVTYTLYDKTKTTQLNKAYYAGEYCIVAHFTNDDPNYKKIEDREAYLTISKIDYDLSDIKFLNVIKFYDGQTYVPSILNKESLPQGLFVHYEIYDEEGAPVVDNSKAGVYTMKAVFTGGDNNHNTIDPMEATLTVAKKIIYIADTLDFVGLNATFTGGTISVTDPSGLPEGVNYTLDQNGFIYVGEYPVNATFATVDPNETTDVTELTVYVLIEPAISTVRVFERNGDDEEHTPIYHNFTLKDIDIDVANNTWSVNVDLDKLCLSDDFINLDCSIVPDQLTLTHTYKDPTTGEEIRVPVEPKDLGSGETYEYNLSFILDSESYDVDKLNESLSLASASGPFKYGHVGTKSGEDEYEGVFNASNIKITNESATIVNVEPGVEAESIKFYLGEDEVPVKELTTGTNVYRYEITFKKQDSAIFIDESGEFTYEEVKTKGTGSEYTEEFGPKNLLILDDVTSIVDTQPNAQYQSIDLYVDNQNGNSVTLSSMEIGHNYFYRLYFTGVGETSTDPGIIWKYEEGTFAYDRVKDSTTHEPITASNIKFGSGNEPYIDNIDSGITANTIEFYTGLNKIPYTDLVVGQTYTYVVSFRSSNTTLYAQETGSITIA